MERNIQHNFKEVEENVSFYISTKNFQKGIEYKTGKRFIIGYLQELKSPHKIDFEKLIRRSRKAIELYPQKIRKAKYPLLKNDEISDADLYDFIIRYIKPFALDLKNTLKTIKKKNEIQQKLIKVLQEYQNFVRDVQIMNKEKNKRCILSYFFYFGTNLVAVF